MDQNIERQLIELIATDRISIPIKSMACKLDREKKRLGTDIDLFILGGYYDGERVSAVYDTRDKMRSRSLRESIDTFSADYPKYGAILSDIIAETREDKEFYLNFTMKPGKKLTREDYMGVMANLGFNYTTSQNLYPAIMDVSRKLSRSRNEERSMIIG